MTYSDRYNRSQLIAHWLVVVLVLMQFLSNERMARAFQQGVESGALPASGGIVVHGLFGSLILGLMLWRVVLRVRHGAPPPSEAEPRPIQFLSRANHFAFYGVLIAMPLAGYAALLTLNPTFGSIHSALATLLLLLIALHIAGALAHVFYFKSDAYKRMLRADPASVVK